MSNIKVELTKSPKPKPVDESKLTFGDVFTDHMLIVNYDEGQGWHDARIVPYGPLSLDPAAMCLHYGQEVFEGMKAYRADDGRVLLFRPQENFKRLNLSNDRLCIPPVDEEFCSSAWRSSSASTPTGFPRPRIPLYTCVPSSSPWTPTWACARRTTTSLWSSLPRWAPTIPRA